MTDKIVVKTDEEWKRLLTTEQFRIARKKGTERPFTGHIGTTMRRVSTNAFAAATTCLVLRPSLIHELDGPPFGRRSTRTT